MLASDSWVNVVSVGVVGFLIAIWGPRAAGGLQFPGAARVGKLSRQFGFVLIAIAIVLGLEHLLPLPEASLVGLINFETYIVLVIGGYYAWRAGLVVLESASKEHRGLANIVHPLTFFSKIIAVVLGLLVLLQGLGVSLTAIWTSLGIGGVAVALALNDTLSNLFAGMYILVDRPVKPGDYITLDTGQAGYVEQVGWRSTRLRAFQQHIVVIPNGTLAKATITNHSLPTEVSRFYVEVGVGYEYDPDWIERILLEEANAARAEWPAILPDPPPVVRFSPGFMDSSMNFTISGSTLTYADTFAAQHAIRKRLYRRFRGEGINIPYPVRTNVAVDATDIGNLSDIAAHTHPGGDANPDPAERTAHD